MIYVYAVILILIYDNRLLAFYVYIDCWSIGINSMAINSMAIPLLYSKISFSSFVDLCSGCFTPTKGIVPFKEFLIDLI